MLIDGKRALAYIVTIDEIKPIPGYDRVEHARTNGWWVIISKNDNLKVGDKCVYFEIDSRVPDTDDRFAFLEKRNYRIKTLRMCKVLSQGLLMPASLFGFDDMQVGTDVTEKLGVVYSADEDNARKSSVNRNAKYVGMQQRHKKLFKTKFFKRMMRYSFGRNILFAIFGEKTDIPLEFPSFISKTDEERIENLPYKLGTDVCYTWTEKLDGMSATYVMERKGKNKFTFTVCSRNLGLHEPSDVRQADDYWRMAYKYDIRYKLKNYLLSNPNLRFVCIQGEIVGPGIQKNPLDLQDVDFYAYNFITDISGRWPSVEGKQAAATMGIKWVPIIHEGKLPDNMENMKASADGFSVLNPNKKREGIVYRSLDGKDSFKNVSNNYLLVSGSKLVAKRSPKNE